MRRLSNCIVAAYVLCVLGAVCLSVKADWSPNFNPDAYPYVVGPSTLVPKWSEVNSGEWTFNYEGVLAKAKSEGRYALVLFSGMWWCPHCQALESNVLTKDRFAQYVAEQGFYLGALDFPFRDGHSMWTWLWDPVYRMANGIGDWTPQQIADECIKRFEFQDLMRSPVGSMTVNNNILVQISDDGSTTNLAVYADNPTTTYRRIAYPTIVMFNPEGKEIGRFGYSFTLDPEKAIDYVIDNIEVIKATERSDLFKDPGAGGIEGITGQTYDAVLTDSSGVPVGTAKFKTAKKNSRTGKIRVSASMQIAGGRAVAIIGTADGEEGEIINLSRTGSEQQAIVKIGAEGLVGSYTDGMANYLVQGARNPFKVGDDSAKSRAASLPKGFWTFSLKTSDNGGNAMVNGYSSFSATIGSKGKVKISGALGDGSGVSVSSQAIIGEGGTVLVPVLGKKGAYSFMLVLESGKLASITGISEWKLASGSVKWDSEAIFAAASGHGTVPDEMSLQLEGFDSAAGIAGKAIYVSPINDTVTVKGRKWTGTKGISDLKVTFKSGDGTFKGTLKLYVNDGGRFKKLNVKVYGVVVNGIPYGTAVQRNVGLSWPMKLIEGCGGGC